MVTQRDLVTLMTSSKKGRKQKNTVTPSPCDSVVIPSRLFYRRVVILTMLVQLFVHYTVAISSKEINISQKKYV